MLTMKDNIFELNVFYCIIIFKVYKFCMLSIIYTLIIVYVT